MNDSKGGAQRYIIRYRHLLTCVSIETELRRRNKEVHKMWTQNTIICQPEHKIGRVATDKPHEKT